MIRSILFIVALATSAIGQTFELGKNQLPFAGPLRSSYAPSGAGDKMLTVLDLDGAFVKSATFASNTVTMTVQMADNTEETVTIPIPTSTGGGGGGATDAEVQQLIGAAIAYDALNSTLTFTALDSSGDAITIDPSQNLLIIGTGASSIPPASLATFNRLGLINTNLYRTVRTIVGVITTPGSYSWEQYTGDPLPPGTTRWRGVSNYSDIGAGIGNRAEGDAIYQASTHHFYRYTSGAWVINADPLGYLTFSASRSDAELRVMVVGNILFYPYQGLDTLWKVTAFTAPEHDDQYSYHYQAIDPSPNRSERQLPLGGTPNVSWLRRAPLSAQDFGVWGNLPFTDRILNITDTSTEPTDSLATRQSIAEAIKVVSDAVSSGGGGSTITDATINTGDPTGEPTDVGASRQTIAEAFNVLPGVTDAAINSSDPSMESTVNAASRQSVAEAIAAIPTPGTGANVTNAAIDVSSPSSESTTAGASRQAIAEAVAATNTAVAAIVPGDQVTDGAINVTTPSNESTTVGASRQAIAEAVAATNASVASIVPGEQNVQADWGETNTGSDDYIVGKPTLGTAAALDIGVSAGEVVTIGTNGYILDGDLPHATQALRGIIRGSVANDVTTGTATDRALLPANLATIFGVFAKTNAINLAMPDDEDQNKFPTARIVAQAISAADLSTVSVAAPISGMATTASPLTIATGALQTLQYANSSVTEEKLSESVRHQLGGISEIVPGLVYEINRNATGGVGHYTINQTHFGAIYHAIEAIEIHGFSFYVNVPSGGTFRLTEGQVSLVRKDSDNEYFPIVRAARGARCRYDDGNYQPRDIIRVLVVPAGTHQIDCIVDNGVEVAENEYIYLSMLADDFYANGVVTGRAGVTQNAHVGHGEFPGNPLAFAAMATAGSNNNYSLNDNFFDASDRAYRMQVRYDVSGAPILLGRNDGTEVYLGPTDIDCQGAGVTCSKSDDGDYFEINVPGGSAGGGEANVQADWNEASSSSDAFIQNKPTLGTAAALNVGVGNGNVATLGMGGNFTATVLPGATEEQAGILELATNAEALAGTNGTAALVATNVPSIRSAFITNTALAASGELTNVAPSRLAVANAIAAIPSGGGGGAAITDGAIDIVMPSNESTSIGASRQSIAESFAALPAGGNPYQGLMTTATVGIDDLFLMRRTSTPSGGFPATTANVTLRANDLLAALVDIDDPFSFTEELPVGMVADDDKLLIRDADGGDAMTGDNKYITIASHNALFTGIEIDTLFIDDRFYSQERSNQSQPNPDATRVPPEGYYRTIDFLPGKQLTPGTFLEISFETGNQQLCDYEVLLADDILSRSSNIVNAGILTVTNSVIIKGAMPGPHTGSFTHSTMYIKRNGLSTIYVALGGDRWATMDDYGGVKLTVRQITHR